MAKFIRKQERTVRAEPFRYDGSFYTITAKIFDMILLNLLWIIGCLPVITAGASFSALYSVTLHSVKEDGKGVCQEFFRVWRRDLKDSIPVWCAVLATLLVLLLNLGILREQPPKLVWLFFIVLFALILAFVIVFSSCVFPAISTFSMPVKWNVKLALYITVRHLPLSFILAVMFFTMYFAMTAFPWLIIILPSVFALFSGFILEPVFSKHMPE